MSIIIIIFINYYLLIIILNCYLFIFIRNLVLNMLTLSYEYIMFKGCFELLIN